MIARRFQLRTAAKATELPTWRRVRVAKISFDGKVIPELIELCRMQMMIAYRGFITEKGRALAKNFGSVVKEDLVDNSNRKKSRIDA